MGDEDGEMADIRDEFPGWHPWRSDGGRWWATRKGRVRFRGPLPDGFAMTVTAETADGVRKALGEQEQPAIAGPRRM